MTDIERGSNREEKSAKRPDLLELLKATAASKAAVNMETARLEHEVSALRALPLGKPSAAA
jgi:hypothetical protein